MAQQTKNAIRRAFIQLLNERPLDKISIKDIAEKGAVNRNTFYYYYADIYALVEDILQLEIQDFQSKLRRYDSWQEAFRDATAFASQNKRAVYHLYNSGNQETLRRYYHKVTLAAMTSYIRDQAEGLPADDEDIRVLSEFYAAALSGLTALWLQNGMKYDTDAYIDHLGHLLDGNIRRALEHPPVRRVDAFLYLKPVAFSAVGISGRSAWNICGCLSLLPGGSLRLFSVPQKALLSFLLNTLQRHAEVAHE